MNTITIDTDTYKAAEAYAKSRNVSIDAFVERLLVRIVSRSERKKKGNIIFLPKQNLYVWGLSVRREALLITSQNCETCLQIDTYEGFC